MCYVLSGLHSRHGLLSMVHTLGDMPVVGLEETVQWMRALHDMEGIDLVRIGRYGDPLSAPLVTRRLLDAVLVDQIPYTAFTRMWDRDDIGKWFRTSMAASVADDGEAREAERLGWRTLYAAYETEGTQCPASKHEAVTCSSCRACGSSSARRSSDTTVKFTIEPHGSRLPNRN